MKFFLVLNLLTLSLGFSNNAFSIHPMISPSVLSSHIEQPSITAIFKDSKGILWIGTQEGLYRFDGSGVTIFNSDETNTNWIPASDIRAISENADGIILVATNGGGLLKWGTNQLTFSRVTHLSAERYSHLMNLKVLKNGNYLIRTKDFLVAYDIVSHSIDPWLESQEVRALVARPFVFSENHSGDIYLGSSRGIFKISLENKSIFKYDLSALKTEDSFGVTALTMKNEHELIFGTDTGHIAVLDTNVGSILAKGKIGGDSSVYVSDISFDTTNLLIATDRGLYLSDHRFLNFKDISNEGTGLSNRDVFVLYADGEHTFIGTYNGLDVLTFSPFRVFNATNSELYNDVLAFDQDYSDHIWIGTYDGLYMYDAILNRHVNFSANNTSSKLNDHRITALASNDHFLWVGFYQGGVQAISLSDNSTKDILIEKSEKIDVTDLSVGKGGEDLWIATYSHGLVRVRENKINFYLDNGSIPYRRIQVLFRLSDESLLIAATSALYLYNPIEDHISKLNLKFGTEQSTPLILSIMEDDRGDVFFGSKDHGLFRWTRKSNKSQYPDSSVRSMNGVKYSTIYGIQIDNQSNIWCSTENGIVKLDPDGNLLKRFTTVDGLQGNDFNLGASFTGRDGLIYFGGANGYNRFDPEEVEIDSSPSPMQLTGITLPGRTFDSLYDFSTVDTLELAHDEKFVTFEFSTLDFIRPEKNQFRYMLENFDSGWIDNGTINKATYNNLPSGDYIFRVQGANSAGIWNEEGIALNVRVLSPPWLSWWAFCLYFVSFLFFIWCVLRIQRSFVLDRKTKLLAMEMFEAENRADDEIQEQLEIQDEIVQSAYDHNLATLTLIGDCISYQSSGRSAEAALTKGSKKRLSALSHLEDCVYYYEGGPVVNLKKYADILVSGMLKTSLLDPDTIVSINDISSELLPAELASPLAIIIFELIENCFLHAFESQSPANYIQMNMEFVEKESGSDKSLKIVISDNGVGLRRKPDRLVKGNTGIGVVGALVKNLAGVLEFELEHGTSVSVTVPIPESLDF